ncbi:MAG: hemolysin family protein [Chloroflexota bacterium]
MLLITFLIILTLIVLSGHYVAAEFSAVSASKPKLAQQSAEGNDSAQKALEIIDDPRQLDDYIAACQLGITLTSLILGFYGQSQLTKNITNWLMSMAGTVSFIEQLSPESIESMSTIIVLTLLTIVTVILGELIPKNVGVQMPERLLLLTLAPMRWSLWLFRPLIWFFNGSGTLILRLFGVTAMSEHAHVHSPEEIQILVEESSEGGILDLDERNLLINTLGLRDVTARKVMIPRNHMLTADVNESPHQLLELLARSRYSRLPLHEGTIDRIVGFVHLKDLLKVVHSGSPNSAPAVSGIMRDHMRPVVIIPESLPVEGILQSMQSDQNYLAIVADEYGGTAGMITVEDLFEEIIGEFYDEFDINRQLVRVGPASRLFVKGDIQVDHINEWLDLKLPVDDADTIGGLIFSQLGKLPQVGDTVSISARYVDVGDDDTASHDHHGDNGQPHDLLEKLAQIEPPTEPPKSPDTPKAEAASQETLTDLPNEHGVSESSESETGTSRLAASGTATIIEFQVEKMQDNSVHEVSFEITEEEIARLEKYEII